MAKADEAKPAQVPGDAESPAKGKTDRTIEEAIRHSDKTEPVQSAQEKSSH